MQVRSILDESLHPGCTLIAIDLLLAAAHSCPADRRDRSHSGPTVKELFSQLSHSSRGVRMHFNRLVQAGLLLLEPGRDDRRTKTVRLSARGEHLIRRVTNALHAGFEREPGTEFHPVAIRRHASALDGNGRRRRAGR